MNKTDQQIITVRQVTLADSVRTFGETALAAASPETLDWYAKRLDLFLKFMGDRLLSDLIEADLWTWYRSVESRVYRGPGPVPAKISVSTFHGYVRAVRRLFHWLADRDLVPVDLSRDLKLPKLPKNGEKGVNDSDALAILRLAQQTHPRDYALISFIESTGCRRGGAANLRLSDLNLKTKGPLARRVSVREKGQKGREVIMSPRALEAMSAWLEVRVSSTNFVFTDIYPNRDDHFGLTPDGISEIFERYKTSLRLRGRVSPHQWRHRTGRKLTSSGMPLNQVSQIMGHASVVVTAEFYGQFAMDTLQSAMDRYYHDPEES